MGARRIERTVDEISCTEVRVSKLRIKPDGNTSPGPDPNIIKELQSVSCKPHCILFNSSLQDRRSVRK